MSWLTHLLRVVMQQAHCYHRDCGGKPIQFCPFHGNHPN